MNLRYFRLNLFYRIMQPFSRRRRLRRMQRFTESMELRDGTTVLDLGGQPEIWDGVSERLHITILNLPGIARATRPSHHRIHYIEDDACNITDLVEKKFDIVFSNSVIEHVGDVERRAAFAREVQRFSDSYWVQTPSIYFPIEAHNGMPFWWFYPKRLRRYFVERWRRKLPAWTEMIETTTVVSKAEMQKLFPHGSVIVERFFGLPKSYIVLANGRGQNSSSTN